MPEEGVSASKPPAKEAQEQAEKVEQLAQQRRARKSTEAAFERAMRLGDSYRKRGNYSAAREQYQRAKELRPESAQPERKLRRLKGMQQATGRGGQKGEADAQKEAAQAPRTATASRPAGALESLARSLEKEAGEGWESTVAEDNRQKKLLGLIQRERGEVQLGPNVSARVEEGTLKVEGPPDEVEAVTQSVKRLRQNMLEESRQITKARKERREERAAKRRADMRRRMAELRAESGGQAGTLSGSRAAGALPLEIRFPRAGTQAFPFRMDYAGTATPSIRLTCIRTSLALVLQVGIVALVFAVIGAVSWGRAELGLGLAAVVALLLGIAMQLGGPGPREYIASGLIAACLAVPIVLGQLLLSRYVRPADDN